MNLEPVLPAIASGGGSSVLIGIALWWFDRRDKNRLAGATQDQAQRDALDKLYASLTTQQAAHVDQLVGRLSEAERDRDRGWDLARFWHKALRSLLLFCEDLRHDAVGMQQWIVSALPHMPPDMQPKSMRPVPDVPLYPAGLEEPLTPRP